MGSLAERYQPASIEKAARAVWAARGFPRPDGIVGRSNAPLVHQFLGSYASSDSPTPVTIRSVAADIDARYLALAGRRAIGSLRRLEDLRDDPVAALLRALSVWVGGGSGQPYDSEERHAGIEAILGRMAGRGLVVTRDASLRICPSCGAPRSPERIVYQQEEGDTYLVRFALVDGDRRVQALAWVDAPWRLLGATALLLHPDLPYVVAHYRRKGVDELILTSRASLARLAEWLPGAEVEVLEEMPGSKWAGHAYEYPLRAEFPMGSELLPPGGTVQVVTDVGDSGTGVVPLVPGHGGTDAQIAERLGVTGWPLVTTRGRLNSTLLHKYAGLDLTTASEFVLRDLGEGGALFARLRVRRGVPHCDVCGSPLVWAPGRAWCLEPSKLPAERLATYRRLLPHDPPIGMIEVAAWPVSDSVTGIPGPGNATLLECVQCERLAPLGAEPACPCGAMRRAVTRPLLPAIQGILGEWARFDPFPPGDSVWIYLNERRRAPALAHQLVVLSAVPGAPTDIGLTVLPGSPEAALPGLVANLGADAVRAGLVRGELPKSASPMLLHRCRQEARRLERYWALARGVLDQIDPAALMAFSPPINGFLSELEPEDRSILARWERVRVATLADYDAQQPARAYRRLVLFLSNDLPVYRSLVRPRLASTGNPSTRRAALRTLHGLVRGTAILLGPVVPHTAEVVYGAATAGGTSLFEIHVDPLDANLLNDERAKSWDRWVSVVGAVDRFRISTGLPSQAILPSAVAVVASDELAQALRADRPTIERLGGVTRFEAFGPSSPWTGRHRDLEPVRSEIQKVYPHEATQILHVLRQMPTRRRLEPGSTDELEVVVQGLPRTITPNMVAYVERIPERMVPAPWTHGELYLEMPPPRPVPSRVPPPLSTDAFGLLRRAERALRQRASAAGTARPPLVIATLDPLATELRTVAVSLAAYLDVPEVRIVNDHREFPRAECDQGRTATGVRWWIHLPGFTPRARPEKHRTALPNRSRVRATRAPTGSREPEVDYAASEWIAREEQIRALMQELDAVLGAPLLGFSKVAGAWDAGLQSRGAYEAVAFDTLAALPGFGWTLAESLVEKLGRVPPPRPPRRGAAPAPPPEPPLLEPGESSSIPPYVEPRAEPLVPPRPASPAPARVSLPAPPSPPPAIFAPAPRSTEAAAPPVLVEPPTFPPSISTPEPPAQEAPPTPPPELIAPTPAPEALPELVESDAVRPIEPVEAPASAPAAPLPLEQADLAPLGSEPSGTAPSLDLPVEDGETPTTELSLSEPEPPTSEPLPIPPEDVRPPPMEFEVALPPLGEEPPVVPSQPEEPAASEPESLTPTEEPLASPGREDAFSQEPPTSPEAPEAILPPEGELPTPRPEPAPAEPASVLPAEENPVLTEIQGPPLPGSDRPELESPPVIPPPSEPQPEAGPEAERTGVPPDLPTEPSPTEALPEQAQEPVVVEASEEVASPVPAPVPSPPAEPIGPDAVAVQPALEVVAAAREVLEVTAEPILPTVPQALVTAPPPPEELRAPTPPAAPMIVAPPTGVQVVVAQSYLPALEDFLETTSAGHRGLAVVRESPERLRTHVGPRPVEVYWLTNLGRGLTVKPNDLEAYGAFLEKAVQQDRVTAVFLEGIEYLARMHGMDRVIERLSAFHTQATEHDARVWVYVHPGLLAPADLDRLVAAFRS